MKLTGLPDGLRVGAMRKEVMEKRENRRLDFSMCFKREGEREK